MKKECDQTTAQDDAQILSTGATPEDSLDDASRRALLGKIARVSATTVPVSLVLLDQAKAQGTSGNSGQSF